MALTVLVVMTAASLVHPMKALEIKRGARMVSHVKEERSTLPILMAMADDRSTPPMKSPASQPEMLVAAAPPPSGGSSVTTSIVNLSKNIVGSGVLALAAGVAAFSSSQIAILPALAILCLLCVCLRLTTLLPPLTAHADA